MNCRKVLLIAELPEQWETLWFVADKPDVIIPLDRVPDAGEEIDVEVILTLRLLYMQIARPCATWATGCG